MNSSGLSIKSVPTSRLLDGAYRCYDRLRRRASVGSVPSLEVRNAALRICLGTGDDDDLRRIAPDAVAPHIEAAGGDQHLLLALRRGDRKLDDRWQNHAAELERRCLSNAAQNLRYRRLLSTIAEVLRRADVPFMLIKGAALLTRYPDLIGRPQCDLDLLVRRDNLKTAGSALKKAGFALDDTGRTVQDYLDNHYHLRFTRDGIMVELHWDIARNTPDGCLDEIWSSMEDVELDGMSWPLPSPGANLLISCVHLSRHGFALGLRWLSDVAFELEHGAADGNFKRGAAKWPPRMIFAPIWLLRSCGVRIPASLSVPNPGAVTDNLLFGTMALRALFVKPDDVSRSQTPAVLQNWVLGDRSLTALFIANAAVRLRILVARRSSALIKAARTSGRRTREALADYLDRCDEPGTAEDAEYFREHGYVVIRRALSEDVAQLVARYAEMNRTLPGYYNQQEKTLSVDRYADSIGESLLLMLQPVIERGSGKKLVPTYSYIRLYCKDSRLKKHTDRPACEISATLTIRSTGESGWPIHVESNGEDVQVDLAEGDLMIYRGIEVPHWRHPLTGPHWTQMFLHYVDVDGEYRECKFDERERIAPADGKAKRRRPKRLTQ